MNILIILCDNLYLCNNVMENFLDILITAFFKRSMIYLYLKVTKLNNFILFRYYKCKNSSYCLIKKPFQRAKTLIEAKVTQKRTKRTAWGKTDCSKYFKPIWLQLKLSLKTVKNDWPQNMPPHVSSTQQYVLWNRNRSPHRTF